MLPRADDIFAGAIGEAASGRVIAKIPRDIAAGPGNVRLDTAGGDIGIQAEGRLILRASGELPKLNGDFIHDRDNRGVIDELRCPGGVVDAIEKERPAGSGSGGDKTFG